MIFQKKYWMYWSISSNGIRLKNPKLFLFSFLFEFSFYLKIFFFEVFLFLRHPMTFRNNFFLGLFPFVVQTQLYFIKFSIQLLMMFVGRDEIYWICSYVEIYSWFESTTYFLITCNIFFIAKPTLRISRIINKQLKLNICITLKGNDWSIGT